MIMICYANCSTCKKAEKYLKNNGVKFEKRDIKTDNPTYDELAKWRELSGLPLKKFFNTSGQSYKKLELSKRLPLLEEEEQLFLLAGDGMLVKRPLLILENKVLVGFKQNEWEEYILKPE